MRRLPSRPIATAAALLAPAAAVVLSVHILLSASLSDFRPYLNDEVYYWHQIATAAAVGTSGGYYGTQELTAPRGDLRFGPHGPVFPLVAGTAARVTGWQRASGPFFNLAWIALGTAAMLALARPSPGRTIVVAILLTTFWPLLLWAASSMQESFHHGIAIALAGALIALARGERTGLAAAWGLALLAAAARPSWGLLIPAVAVMSLRQVTVGRAAAAASGGLAVAGGILVVFGAITPPAPGAFEFMELVRFDGGFTVPTANMRQNITRLLDTSDDYDPLEIVHRAQYLALTVAVLVWTTVLWVRPGHDVATRRHLTMQSFSLAGIVVAMIAMYTLTNWTEHRIISSHVLLAALTLALLPAPTGLAMAIVLIASNLATLPVYTESFRQNRSDNFSWDRRSLRRFEEAVGGRLLYRPDASPWCNTLLTTQYPPDFVAVPPGIGITVARSGDRVPRPPRSRYLLLDQAAYAEVGDSLNLELVGTVAYGTVYINRNAACDR